MGEQLESSTIPVILDTDIGTDIDDTWALAMLLKSPELDLRLVTTATGDTTYRARLAARILDVAGRSDVPVAAGRCFGEYVSAQSSWVSCYDLTAYKGGFTTNAAESIVSTIMDSDNPVTVIAIGPLTNISDALKLEPRIAQRARFTGMHGSLKRRHDNAVGAIAEWNVVGDIQSAQEVFAAAWPKTITPLDTCGSVRLGAEALAQLRGSKSPLIQCVLENYRIWLDHYSRTTTDSEWLAGQPDQHSSILFDTVAIHLAYSRQFLRVETVNLSVTDDGYTVADEGGQPVDVATEWEDLPGYREFLLGRLLS